MSHGNERWFEGTEVAVKADGTLLGFRTKAIDDAGAYLRYEPLGGVIWSQVAAGLYKWRNIRRRVHAGDDEQGARVAEPRLLPHAAALVHRAGDRHRRAGARLRPGRDPQARTSSSRRTCRTRRRTAASTTRATIRARWTWRSS